MTDLPELPAPPTMSMLASRADLRYTAEDMRSYARQAVAAEMEQFRRLVLDDAWAMTFQTMGQYRTALAKAMGEQS